MSGMLTDIHEILIYGIGRFQYGPKILDGLPPRGTFQNPNITVGKLERFGMNPFKTPVIARHLGPDLTKYCGDNSWCVADADNRAFAIHITKEQAEFMAHCINGTTVEGEAAKEEHKQEEFKALENVRDLLGHDQVQLAIEYIEKYVANDEALGRLMNQLPYVGAFESSFKTAMRKHNLIAGFVIIEPVKKENGYSYRMITGGHHVADAVLSFHLKPLADALGKNLGPNRSFLEIVDLVKRNALKGPDLPQVGKT